MKRSALKMEGHSIEDEKIIMVPLSDVNAWAFGNQEEQGNAVVDLNQQQEGILPDQEEQRNAVVDLNQQQQKGILPVVLEQQNSVVSDNVEEEEEKAAVSEENPEDDEEEEEKAAVSEEKPEDDEEEEKAAPGDLVDYEDEEKEGEVEVLEGAEEVPQEVKLAAPEGQSFQLVIEKDLTDSDVSRYNLSLPGGQLKIDRFLDDKQSGKLKRNRSIEVYVRNIGGERRSTVMKLDKSGGSTKNKFTSFLKWKDFVLEKKFKEHDTIQLWKFEENQEHEFVLRKI